jgi:hypothetical protein
MFYYVTLMNPSMCIIFINVLRSTKGSSLSALSVWLWAVTYYTASIKSFFNLSKMMRLFLALIAFSSFIFYCLNFSSFSSCLDLCFLTFSSEDIAAIYEFKVGSPWIKRSMLFFYSAFLTFLVRDDVLLLLVSLIVDANCVLGTPTKLLDDWLLGCIIETF